MTLAPGQKTVTVTLGDYVLLRVGQPVNVTVHYADGGSSRVQVSNHYIVDVDRFTWFNVSNRDGWLKVNPVHPSETLNVIVPPPRNSVSWVSFIVEDFGQNFTEVRLYTLDGKLAWRERLSPATRTATALLKQYDTYILSVSKPTWERAFGAFVVDRSMFTLVVPPVVEQLPPPPYATAVYNSTLKALIVDVTCRSYCTVKLRKHTLTGVNATATYTCSTGRCRFTWYTGDPVFEVEVVDETGRTSYRTFTGTPVELVKPATGWELYALNATLGPLARRWGVDVRTLLVVFASTAVFLSLCVAGYMDIACIATIAVSLLLQWR
ncbi:MAG: hypothetical protein NZ954_08740, partial [Thermofilaceae archaeon]|nr:hypothetical protein [Thermofilaceae archaeon]